MNKPTDANLIQVFADGAVALSATVDGVVAAQYCGLRALHDAGIAHGKAEGKADGWREAIEALRNQRPSATYWADYLERLAKERGYV